VWSAEAYGSDAVTPTAWIAARTERIHVGTAIMQIPARTPAMTAATASGFDVMPMVPVVVGDDVAACRAAVKPRPALYVRGMGARGRNFYNDIARRYGYEDAAARIEALYLGGRKDEAAAVVPDALVDEVALGGPRERIRERLTEWTGAGVTTLMVAGDVAAARTMAELVL
jgi:alkanesulfonate monooxygenase SsuD/methylene tetrahydromethanopterin reductase-like flavin-dependent oxidoreductase (luciferase family)